MLIVHDLQRVASFYEAIVGLVPLREDGHRVLLGAGESVLVELRRDPAARRWTRDEAGLFHTAFLLPDHAALARWYRHAVDAGQALIGAADHAVSEALYLSDPEGNGIEIYADRPRSEWRWRDGVVDMPNAPLDLAALSRTAAGGSVFGKDPSLTIGHVHLQVGEIAAAETFYAGTLGLDVTHRYPAATFYAAGGYHHQLATNVWNSEGTLPRAEPATGLAEVAMSFDARHLAAIRARVPDAFSARGDGLLADPWGTRFRLLQTTKPSKDER